VRLTPSSSSSRSIGDLRHLPPREEKSYPKAFDEKAYFKNIKTKNVEIKQKEINPSFKDYRKKLEETSEESIIKVKKQ
jgi:hypothetical protein